MNVTNKIPNNYKSNCLKLKQVQINEMRSEERRVGKEC